MNLLQKNIQHLLQNDSSPSQGRGEHINYKVLFFSNVGLINEDHALLQNVNTGYSYKFHFLTICLNFATKSIGNGQSVPSTCSSTLGYGIPSSPDSHLQELLWKAIASETKELGDRRWPPISREKVSFNQEQTHGLNLLKRCFNGLTKRILSIISGCRDNLIYSHKCGWFFIVNWGIGSP